MTTRLTLATQLAKAAGDIELKYFRKPVDAASKNPRDVVTQADIEAEQAIITGIKARFPDDAILAEESGAHEGNTSEYSWIIDPLDGTGNFFKGSPEFCVMIGILKNGHTEAAVIWFPVRQELYAAEKGKGATKNNESLQVSSESDLKAMYANTHMSSKLDVREANLKLYEKTLMTVRNIHVINACIGRLLCDVAEGIADFHFRIGMNLWDYIPGSLIVEEAGGIVTDISGQPITEGATGVLASNGRVHERLVELIK